MKTTLSLLLFFAFIPALKAQKTFTLTGHVNLPAGTIILSPVADIDYYPAMKLKDTMNIEDGKFTFTGPCTYPYQFRLVINRSGVQYVSRYFMVEPGTQTISYNVDAPDAMMVSGKSMAERKDLLAALDPADHRIDSLADDYNTLYKTTDNHLPKVFLYAYQIRLDSLLNVRQQLLQQYITTHTGSYAALWEIVKGMKGSYSTAYDKMLAQFSSTVKRSYTGKTLSQKLADAKTVAIGATFPVLSLTDINGKKVKTPAAGNQYTLINFWVSNNTACTTEFAQLKNIYMDYKPKGFAIVNVATDKKEMVKDWKEAVANYQLPWEQYLDQDAKNAGHLTVQGYPSNFLLDSKGHILKRDIDMVQLRTLLKEKLH